MVSLKFGILTTNQLMVGSTTVMDGLPKTIQVRIERSDGTFENYGVRELEIVDGVMVLKNVQPDPSYYGRTVRLVPTPEQIEKLRAENEALKEKLNAAIRYIDENPSGSAVVGGLITDGFGLIEYLEADEAAP